MILNGENVTDEEFFNKIAPIDKHFRKLIINCILPEAVAFYLTDCYFKECLCESPLYNHINSTLEMLCDYHKSINTIIPVIERILLIKYNLKITNYDPLEFEICDVVNN